MQSLSPRIHLERGNNGDFVVRLFGDWTIHHLDQIDITPINLPSNSPNRVLLCENDDVAIDTSGALVVIQQLLSHAVTPAEIDLSGLSERTENIFSLVLSNLRPKENFRPKRPRNLLSSVGKFSLSLARQSLEFLGFIGEVSIAFKEALLNPKKFRIREFVNQLELCFVRSIPIVSLVTALIGVVVAYLSAVQIEKFGANIFVVDAVSLAMCRELSPIIVAIIVAGRSGSAFTAQLGAMKLNDEVSAISTLGLSPMQVLVLPRILALLIAMPLLVFAGDVVGISGSALVANLRFNITIPTFLERLESILTVQTVVVGLIKAPVFALFIALIGCRFGLTVKKDSRSIGINTTATVVQSIVSVILLNAGFAVIFSELGI